MKPKVSKVEAELKRLTKIDGNKTCADCPEKMPSYADLTNKNFVCTKCAGIHRDFQFKVKGISMSVFTEEDVASLASVGNVAFNEKYMANFNTRDYILPNGSDIVKLKEFIRSKYFDKKWYHDDGASNSSTATDSSEARKFPAGTSTTNGFGSGAVNIKPLTKQTSVAESDNKSKPFGTFSGTANTTSHNNSSANNHNANNITDSLDLLSMDDPIPAPVAAPIAATHQPTSVHNNNAGFGVFDPFAAPVAATPAASTASFDPFATSNAASTSAGGSQTFDAFSPNASNSSSSGFDAFGPSPIAGTMQPPQQHFNPSSQSGFNTSFSNFGNNNMMQPAPTMSMPAAPMAAPMPFIRLAPPAPAAVAPVAETTASTGTPAARGPDPKNFSAFDELAPPPAPLPQYPPQQQQQQQQGRNNPFESPTMSGNYPSAGLPYGNVALPPPVAGAGGYGAPRGMPPQQQQQQYPPHYPQQQQQPPYGYGAPPPQQQQQMPYGYPPQQQQQPPQHGYGYPGGYNQQSAGAYPGAAPGGYSSQPPPAAQKPAAPAPVDPFAAMTGLAWTAVGATSAPPSAAPVNHFPSSTPVPAVHSTSVPVQQQQQYHAPPTGFGQQQLPLQGQYSSTSPQQSAAASVNPFDMF